MTLEELDALSRVRPLTPEESLRLEHALNRKAEPKGQKPWTNAELRRLERLLKRGRKPAFIATILKRSERAVWRKIYKEGLQVGKLCPADVYTPSRLRVQSRRER